MGLNFCASQLISTYLFALGMMHAQALWTGNLPTTNKLVDNPPPISIAGHRRPFKPLIDNKVLTIKYPSRRTLRRFQDLEKNGTGGSNPNSIDDLKTALLKAVSAANNPSRGTNPRELYQVVERAAAGLADANPTQAPALSPRISARWALLYTGRSRQLAPASFLDPGESPSPGLFRVFLQRASDATYSFFYDSFPLLAGSAVGPRTHQHRGSTGTRIRNVQVIDAAEGKVENIAEFDGPLCDGRLCVSGSARPVIATRGDKHRRLRVVFEGVALRIGRAHFAIPLIWLSPVGFVDTLFLDDDLRVSVGDKGSLFVVQRIK